MLPPKFEFFTNLELNCACELLCPGCPFWQTNDPVPLKKLRFNSRAIHLTGGNPLSYPDLPKLLVQLKQAKRFVTLTTCGYRLETLEPKLLLLIDLVLLYLPGCTGENSIKYSGFNSSPKQIRAIEYLQEFKRKFAVLYPADSETLEDLPDLYHKLNKRNSYLLLLYNKKSEYIIPRQERNYLYYYAQRPNTLVYTYKSTAPLNCQDFTRNLKQLTIPNLLFLSKLFFKLYFFN